MLTWLAPCCFLAYLALGAALWRGGRRLGAGRHAAWWAGGALALLAWAAWLAHQPAWLLRVLPAGAAVYAESTVVFPMLMALLGIAAGAATEQRARRLCRVALVIGVLWFTWVAGWMVQRSPARWLALQPTPTAHQTQWWSCVPASCARALNQLGLDASEAEMADLTLTRRWRGSTLLRAYWGLQQRLQGTGYEARLLPPDWDQLQSLPPSATGLALLRLEPGRTHMVAVTGVDRHLFRFEDPTDGVLSFTRAGFETHVRDPLIVIVPATLPAQVAGWPESARRPRS